MVLELGSVAQRVDDGSIGGMLEDERRALRRGASGDEDVRDAIKEEVGEAKLLVELWVDLV